MPCLVREKSIIESIGDLFQFLIGDGYDMRSKIEIDDEDRSNCILSFRIMVLCLGEGRGGRGRLVLAPVCPRGRGWGEGTQGRVTKATYKEKKVFGFFFF